MYGYKYLVCNMKRLEKRKYFLHFSHSFSSPFTYKQKKKKKIVVRGSKEFGMYVTPIF